eukprot:TRINITY_DN1560_c0_g2_i1.p1 TRINITY_DN1560_c0_g2~~TRINITY_DN1560_c0_g2_i1.p1  ORF type:complete len:321 (+),score=31.34 TRINITY_DN1560_c0_g2_i1:519-1481(+)
MDTMKRGDLVTIFVPDNHHFFLAKAAVERGLHVLLAKPAVKTLQEHQELVALAEKNGCLVAVEVHKRWDPMYSDARERCRGLGDFSYFQSYMSQPKKQLDTFRGWDWVHHASDVSYYLNAHHVDWLTWALHGISRPVSVTATASTGIAASMGIPTEDTITLLVQWENVNSKRLGHAIFTSSWVAPKSDVHSQQRFHYMGTTGEVAIDQAHRGYACSTDGPGYASCNPLFMRYTPTAAGGFGGQHSYGYLSIATFVDAVHKIRAGGATPNDFCQTLATLNTTVTSTAILDAGRQSLDMGGKQIEILYGADPFLVTGLRLKQ